MSAADRQIARMISRNHRLADIKARVEDPRLIERRRAETVHIAAELYSRHGYHQTTMQEIAERAGVSVEYIPAGAQRHDEPAAQAARRSAPDPERGV